MPEQHNGRRDYLHVAQRIFNTPLLIDPRKLEAIVEGLRDRFRGVSIEIPDSAKAQPMAFDPAWDAYDWSSDLTIQKGVAILPIDATLVHKGRWVGAYSGLQSYDGISQQLSIIRSKADAGEIHTLLLNLHSHGGEVAGCFDLVDELYALRDQVRTVALVADAACSAAYAIASAAEEIVITQAGYCGSIGVVYTHFDYSQMAEQMGVAITHIYAGKDKILGSPYRPLSESDRKKLQEEVDGLYEIFVAKVARNRGLDPQAVRDTEANVFYAEQAVELGLADRIAAPRDLLAELQDQNVSTSGAAVRQEIQQMTTQPKGAAGNRAANDPLAEVESSFGKFIKSLRNALSFRAKPATASQPQEEEDSNTSEYVVPEDDEEKPKEPEASRGVPAQMTAEAAVARVKKILTSAEALQ